ncbi:MAG: YdcF family protein [Lawsonibacter sp.]|jgi:uncharacterized SAM-binding protein YcdF (DUF218 family)
MIQKAREIYCYRGRSFSWRKGIIVLLLAGVFTFAGLLGAVLYGAYDHVSGQPQVMIVLGCQVKPWGPSVLLQDRLDEALRYLEDHPDLKVVVSGGQGPDEPVSEARAMADYLMERGISEEIIYLESESHNTAQNFQYTAQLLQEEGYNLEETQVLVVSNGFHLTRARMLAQRAGFDEVSTLAAPSSDLPARLKMYLREPLALAKSFLLDH